MRIAQVAPLWEQLPPESHRSVEFSVSALTDELVRRGHDVTLFAAPESDTLAWLEPCCDQALNDKKIRAQDYSLYEQMQLSRLFKGAGRFDIIHVHDCLTALPYAAASKTPVVHTLYRQPSDLEQQFCLQHRRQPLVAAYPGFAALPVARRLRLLDTIPAVGNPESLTFYSHEASVQPYLAYLGDLSQASGINRAIAIAQASGLPLQIAAIQDSLAEPAHPTDACLTDTHSTDTYFNNQVQPKMDGRQVKFLGRISDSRRNAFLGQALATLSVQDCSVTPPWDVMESLASGTPVIALDPGLKPWLDGGRLGFIGEGVADCAAAVRDLHRIQRQDCRQWAMAEFGAAALGDRYEAVYHSLVKGQRSSVMATRRLQLKATA